MLFVVGIESRTHLIMKNKTSHKIISTSLSVAMLLFTAQPAFAASDTPVDDFTSNISYAETLNEYGLDGNLMEKVMSVLDHIYFDKDNNTLQTDLSDDDLASVYNFTYQQLINFHAILEGTYQPPKLTKTLPETRSTRYYLSYQDLTQGVLAVLGSAAAPGPAALMAAWTGVSSALSGPLGTVASVGVSILGYGFFANLAFKITGAIAQQKGVAFYLDWGVPPVTAEIE